MTGANTGTLTSDTASHRSVSTRSRSKSSRATIDDFEFHRVLGKGKYGKVLLCSHKVSKKVFAIKVIQKDAESEDTARTESEILRSIKHPFIVGLHFAFQNPERLYLVMEYVNGGELFFHLSQSGRFPEKRAKFYAAEIILALQCLHGKGVVYRDLKLENILLDKEGHIKIADFGLSRLYTKEDETRTFSMAGTLEYFAPEVIEGVNYSFPADWWAFGVILFELLCGYHPFYNPNPDILYQLILRAPLEFPSFTSGKAADLITRLLDRDYKRRLGSGKLGSREIQQHPFFKDIDWTKLFRKELPPPWRPDVADDFDVKFFDAEFTSEAIEDEDVKGH
ncbi:kinase-like domain-containing protein [Catenaria anguillulae PL171]|uniref:Kinase-like domain-containing protein n=1 Tax=Catenaria anguillulae PL171 TaxID=765915 RepID=A0A1Y2I348_9FUNG|nr:kinase-like domain-containing protein [Catenaria anguillulae PL171]